MTKESVPIVRIYFVTHLTEKGKLDLLEDERVVGVTDFGRLPAEIRIWIQGTDETYAAREKL